MPKPPLTAGTPVEELLPWEYVQKTMTLAGLGLWRLLTDEADRLKLIFNDSYLNLVGYTRAEFPVLLQDYLDNLVHPDDKGWLGRLFKDSLERREASFRFKYRLLHGRSGQWRWVEVFGEATYRDEDGRPLEIFGCLIDVHEATAARAQLEANEAVLKSEKAALERRMAERARIMEEVRKSLEDLTNALGNRLDEVQKSLREDMRRSLDALGADGDADDNFNGYLASAFKYLGNELVWYKAVLDNLPFPTSVFDLERRWTYLNPSAALAMGGRAVSDYLGRPYAEGWKNYQDSQELDDNDDIKTRTFTRYLKDSKKILSGQSSFLEDHQGREIGFIETLFDITQAHEAEERTRLMLDATPLSCCFFDQRGNVIDCNLEAAAICGFKNKRIYLEQFFKLMPPYLPDGRVTAWALMENVRLAFEKGRAFMGEMALRTADGTDIPGEAFFRRVEWRDEYIVLAYFRDLRDLKATREKLDNERLLLRDILDGCPVPFAIIADGVVKFTTPATRTDLGLETGSPAAHLVADQEELETLRRALKDSQAVNWRPLKIIRADGALGESLLNAYPARFEGRPALMTWLMDVTQLRRNERELSVARDLAEASTRAKSDFLANISHEIRTPMNAIIGLTNLLQESDLNSQQLELAEKTGSAAKSLLYLINDILDFSTLDSGKLKLKPQEFYLQNVLKETVSLVAAQVSEKGLEFMILVAPNAPAGLVGDEHRLLQTLNILLGNAVKFTEKGEISLTVEVAEEKETEATLLFLIRDTGIGLKREQIQNLFAPFTQADASFTRRYGGTGLGLAISKKLVALMGGAIWCESEPGQGSTFGFTARFGRHNHAERFVTRRQDFSGLSALIVDDNELARAILNKYLKAFGFAVATAASGEEALAWLAQARAEGRRLDLVTLDFKMPGLDGLETARRLAGLTRTGQKPVIIMATAYSRADLIEAAAEAGIRTVLEKPLSPSALQNVLSVIFEGARPAGEAEKNEAGSTPLTAEEDKKLARAAKGPDASELVKHLAGARILLVEDNEINQMVAQKTLKRAGLDVSVANNGQEALDMARNNRYDLVLMDIQMPVMDGLTAAQEIRRLERGGDMPIVALTAHARDEDREKSLSSGMNDHLTKPLNTGELFRCLAKWIKTGAPARP